MKEYIWQFYNEGFATTFYIKPIDYLRKNIKNKILFNILSILVKILYTVMAIAFAIIILFNKLK